ncbi:hypothetical protein KEM48_010368 [Puccinia striiformis f. sp. tritici PST-130]|nr:hypothetical protein Pst134EB_027410 [Puccinia striiformis f. sp. tritici]KAI9626540.1 hypothetical protein KEM48_010368 [Puccinia striiformis f. sp. tritici PST-130]
MRRIASAAAKTRKTRTFSSLSLTSNHYLDQLNQSLHSDSYHQLSSPAYSQILNHLQSHKLYNELPTNSFEKLLDFNPSGETKDSIHSIHYYLYHRIIFLLDRIYELQPRFTQDELDRFHSISLKRLANVGLYKPAELIWDQLVSSKPNQDDQVLMLDCIKTAFKNYHSSPRGNVNTINENNNNNNLLPLTDKDLKRMINLTQSIGQSLQSSTLDHRTERWTVRTVSEIYVMQGEEGRLMEWLHQHRCLDLDFPDNGAAWSDPKITATVIKLYKDQNRLDKMISIYEAALNPTPQMCLVSEQAHSFFCATRPTKTIEQRKSSKTKNPILTRTYHDLISACIRANLPHLSLHYLTRAIRETERYTARLSLIQPTDFPPSMPFLRLQPATYSELIPYLVKKKRDTQLKKVYSLTERLIKSIVIELNWIKDLAAFRSGSDSLVSEEEDLDRWKVVVANVLPELLSGGTEKGSVIDLQSKIDQNMELEDLVFRYTNRPKLKTSLPSKLIEDPHLQEEEQESREEREEKDTKETQFLRLLERTKFLSKSCSHSISLLNRLSSLILKTKVNRDLRFEVGLLKQKKMKAKKSSAIVSLHNRTAMGNASDLVPVSGNNLDRNLQRIENLVNQKNSLKFQS